MPKYKYPASPTDNILIARGARHGRRLRSSDSPLSPIPELPQRGRQVRRNLSLIMANQEQEADPTAEAIQSLTKQLHALSVKLDPFKGLESENISDFIKDFNNYVNNTGQTSEEDKKQVLQTHLKDLAKQWWKLQDDTKPIAELLELLKERFKLTDHAKHSLKIRIFGMKQKDSESYLEFVSSVRSKSRQLGLTEEEQVAICLSGAKPELRTHLAMQSPKTFKDLLNLPIARDETLCAPNNTPSFVNIVQEIRDLKDTMENNSKKVQFLDVRTDNTDKDHRTTERSTGQYTGTIRPQSPHRSRDNSPAVRDIRTSSRDRSYAQALTDPVGIHGGLQRCDKCGSTSYCHAAPYVCPAYDRFCYNCGRQGHFRNLCRAPPSIRPPQDYRRQNDRNRSERFSRDRPRRDQSYSRNYRNQNDRNYQNYNNNRDQSRPNNRNDNNQGNFRSRDRSFNRNNSFRNGNRRNFNNNNNNNGNRNFNR